MLDQASNTSAIDVAAAGHRRCERDQDAGHGGDVGHRFRQVTPAPSAALDASLKIS
jgi:hypothetical protein